MSPERSFETYEADVTVAKLVTPRNIHLQFKVPPGKLVHFKAGQFFQVFIPQPDKPLRRSYSVASTPNHEDYIELCVTLVETGKASPYLHKLKPGDKITMLGPLGKFGYQNPLPRDPVFIATGSGIAPFRSMINDIYAKGVDKGRTIYLVFGNRFDDDVIYKDEWEALAARQKNFKHLFTLSKPTPAWKGSKGYVQDQIEGFVPDPKGKDFFICGLANMIDGVQAKLLSLGVPKEQIHFEKYD